MKKIKSQIEDLIVKFYSWRETVFTKKIIEPDSKKIKEHVKNIKKKTKVKITCTENGFNFDELLNSYQVIFKPGTDGSFDWNTRGNVIVIRRRS